ncbi:MAG: hypothetical protein KatS3mg060_0680 [Dehalococcoidia bacterium]|nr:MAG: hypothetical protein KatS3mg060_0680 [Dehalococcoidia bacterium]
MAVGLGTFATVWGLLRDNSFAEIDANLARPARIAVTGASPAERNAVIEALARGGEPGVIGHEVEDPALELQLVREGDIVRVILVTPGFKSTDSVELPDLAPETIAARLGPAIFDRLPLEVVGFGRRLPALRELAANQEIRDYSLLNAQIAAISNIPDIIPVLGPFIAGAAEMLLLTKNQIILVYKLAAIYGRPLGDKKALLSEVVTIFGAAYVWRLVARQLAGFAPFGLGIIPKVTIAFVATYTEGKSAQHYFLSGSPPPQELLGRFIAEAKEIAARVLPQLKRRGAAGPELVAPASTER